MLRVYDCLIGEIERKLWLKPRRNGGQSVRFGGRIRLGIAQYRVYRSSRARPLFE
jgi:hypothetical protein